MIPVRGPHQSEALGGCLVCLCLRPALKRQAYITFHHSHRRIQTVQLLQLWRHVVD